MPGAKSAVVNGPLAGRSLRQVVTEYPAELMGAGWSGDRFPVLTKFIDASGALPVHLHADDEAAQASLRVLADVLVWDAGLT